jgi:hypothetical protein
MALTIFETALRILVNTEETPENLLAEHPIRILRGVIGKQTPKEHVASITANHTSDRPIIKVGVVGDAVVPTAGSLFTEEVHRHDASLICTIVDVAEQGHIHRPGISGHIKIISRKRRIRLDPVV